MQLCVIICCVLLAVSGQKMHITKNDWTTIRQDNNLLKVNSSHFYYLDHTSPNTIKWKIDQEYIKSLDVGNEQALKLAFKIWTNEPVIGVIKYRDLEHNISQLANDWVYNEIVLSKFQLAQLEIQIMKTDKDSIAIQELMNHVIDGQELMEGNDETDQDHWQKNNIEQAVYDSVNLVNDCKFTKGTLNTACLNLKSQYKISNTSITLMVSGKAQEYGLNLTYWTSEHVTINVYVRRIDEPTDTNDRIFSMKPMVSKDETQTESTRLLLSDLIAIRITNFALTVETVTSDGQPVTGLSLQLEELSVQYEDNPNKFFTDSINNLIDGSTPEWKSQWKHISPQSPYVSVTQDQWHILFKGVSHRSEPSSAHILSKWVHFQHFEQYFANNSLTLKVANSETFNAFRLTPRVCDQIGHCIDGYYTQVWHKSDTIRYLWFNFEVSALSHTSYVKLLLYVEYFQFGRLTTTDLQITLNNFGNPCTMPLMYNMLKNNLYLCNKGNSYNRQCNINATTGEPYCKCEPGQYGQDCEFADYCHTKSNQIGVSGNKHCKTNYQGNCVNVHDSFMCLCERNAYWDTKKLNCTAVKQVDLRGEQIQFPSILNKTNDKLLMPFIDVETNDQDICLNINYHTDEQATLNITYNQDIPYEYYLDKTIQNSTLQVCVSDVRYKIEANFELAISLDSSSSNQVVIHSIETYQKPKPAKLTQIKYWEIDKVNFQNSWKIIPENSFIADHKLNGFYLNVNYTKTYHAKLVSNWITPVEKLNQYDHYFFVSNPAAELTYTSMIMQQNGDHVQYSQAHQYESSSGQSPQQIPLPDDMDKPYKIILSFVFNSNQNHSTYEGLVSKLAVADGCWTSDCNWNNTKDCVSTGPEAFTCVCKQGYAGPTCDWINRCNNQTCPDSPLLLDFNGDKCWMTSETDYQCGCDDQSYMFDTALNKCYRTTKYHEQSSLCMDNNCPIFDKLNNDTTWVPKLSMVNKPVYFTNMNHDTMRIDIDLGDFQDVCFNITYKCSPNSSLVISHNDKEQIELKAGLDETTEQVIICAKNMTKNVLDHKFTITISSNLTSQADYITFYLAESDIAFIGTDGKKTEYPCFDPATNQQRSCSNVGQCVGTNEGALGYKCQCDTTHGIVYQGDNCELIDNCKSLLANQTGEEYCIKLNKGQCLNMKNGFRCQCLGDMIWNEQDKIKHSTGLSCHCDENQVCIEQDGQANCQCEQGFYSVTQNAKLRCLDDCTKMNCTEKAIVQDSRCLCKDDNGHFAIWIEYEHGGIVYIIMLALLVTAMLASSCIIYRVHKRPRYDQAADKETFVINY